MRWHTGDVHGNSHAAALRPVMGPGLSLPRNQRTSLFTVFSVPLHHLVQAGVILLNIGRLTITCLALSRVPGT